MKVKLTTWRHCAAIAMCLSLLVAGCRSMSWTAWKPSAIGTTGASPTTGDSSVDANKPVEHPTPTNSFPEQTIRQRPLGPSLAAPKLESATTAALDLTVTAPSNVTVGESARFEISVTNKELTDIENVEILCEYDAGLAFPGQTDRLMRQSLGRLKANETRQLSIALQLESSGNHCARFQLQVDGLEVDRQEVCVSSAPTDVELILDGPELRFEETRAEYSLTVKNISNRNLGNTVVSLAYPEALAAKEASAGSRRAPGKLTWDLGTLRVKERVQIQVEFECKRAIPSGRVTAKVTHQAGASVASLPVVVRPLDTPLQVSIDDSADPIDVDGESTISITLTNRSATSVTPGPIAIQPTREVSITDVSLHPSSLGQGVQSQQVGRDLRVRGLPTISPQESVTIQVRLLGDSVGRASVVVLFQPTPSTGEAMTLSESLTINPRKIGPDVTNTPNGSAR